MSLLSGFSFPPLPRTTSSSPHTSAHFRGVFWTTDCFNVWLYSHLHEYKEYGGWIETNIWQLFRDTSNIHHVVTTFPFLSWLCTTTFKNICIFLLVIQFSILWKYHLSTYKIQLLPKQVLKILQLKCVILPPSCCATDVYSIIYPSLEFITRAMGVDKPCLKY